MSDTTPLVTIIIPAYNSERYVVEAVASAQNQSQSRIEILVVDDGSRDNTATLVAALAAADPRILMISQANAGPSAARNEGLRHARGKFIAFLDADDTLHELKIAKQVDALERTGAGVAFCDYYTTDEDLVPRSISPTRPLLPSVKEQLPLQNVFPVHAALVRKEVVERVGLLDESLLAAEDWDYWIRCAQVTAMVHVPGALCAYRRHADQGHNDRRSMRASQLRVVRKNYHPRTRERRMAMAAYHLGEARYQYGQGRCARTLLQLLKVLMLTRTPTSTRRVVSMAGYG